MITALKYLGILAIVTSACFAFLPVVEELPFGMETIIQTLVSILNGLADNIPWLVVPLKLFLYALSIQFILFVWQKVAWLISLIR